jgi:hypothetical protein
MNMPFDSIESEAIKCLRVTLARARVDRAQADGSARLDGLCRAIAAALKGLAVGVQPVSEDAEWRLACSPAVYDEHAIVLALLQVSHVCARRGRPSAAEAAIEWLRRSVADPRVIELMWRLMQVQHASPQPFSAQTVSEKPLSARDELGVLMYAKEPAAQI